jgi:hypothetical protein
VLPQRGADRQELPASISDSAQDPRKPRYKPLAERLALFPTGERKRHWFLCRRPELPPGNPSGIPVYIKDGGNPGVFTTLRCFGLGCPIVPVGAALPVADEKGRDRRLRCEFFRLALASTPPA